MSQNFREMANIHHTPSQGVFSEYLFNVYEWGHREKLFSLKQKLEAHCFPIQENVTVSPVLQRRMQGPGSPELGRGKKGRGKKKNLACA
jgi:hypothetical protein